MFQDMHSFQQEVKAKQARLQAQVAQQRLLKVCGAVGQPTEISGQPEIRRSWFLALRFILVRQPK